MDISAKAATPNSPSHNAHAANLSDAPNGLPHAFMAAKKALAMPFTQNAHAKPNTSAVPDAAKAPSSPMASRAAAAPTATGGTMRNAPGERAERRQCMKVGARRACLETARA